MTKKIWIPLVSLAAIGALLWCMMGPAHPVDPVSKKPSVSAAGESGGSQRVAQQDSPSAETSLGQMRPKPRGSGIPVGEHGGNQPQPAFQSFAAAPFQPDAKGEVIHRYEEEPLLTGEPAQAAVSVAGTVHRLTPNQAGVFQRVTIKPSSEVAVSVTYPTAKPGEKVMAQVLDGGVLETREKHGVYLLDDTLSLKLRLKVNEEAGIYRVLLRKGDDEKTVELWAGEETPVVVRN